MSLPANGRSCLRSCADWFVIRAASCMPGSLLAKYGFAIAGIASSIQSSMSPHTPGAQKS
jgi:hypothetical protein